VLHALEDQLGEPRRVERGRGVQRWVTTGAGWAGALSAAPGFVFDAGRRTDWLTLPSADYPGAIGLAALGVVATVVVGVILGRRASWAALPIAAVGGTAVLACWYIAMMEASYPATDPTVDNATGAGLVILGVPALAVIFGLLALGMVAGRFTGRSAAARHA
jgi:hypothetical protein